ncbi:glycosyltransferase family 4 protein [Microbacterium arborescens]|uniref:glycosyltransferase family 4 protein n=1 Tax=Microbacterium arborescens TaxID=33883 RepID=UPI000DF7A378|nr:glycosyltransferase family 1 protein [Microbacterium arborescens]
MRILVDLLGYTGGRGGTETYVRELLPRLAGILPDADFVAVTGRSGAAAVSGFFPGRVETVPWVGADRATWALGEILAVSRRARRARADLVWSPANFGPVTRGAVPRVVSIHDVIYHEVRGTGIARFPRAVTAWLMARAARTADRVLTVSDAAGAAISHHLGLAGSRITVVHNGSAPSRRSADPLPALRSLGVSAERPLLLSAGNRMPHKNFAGLLAALATIEPALRPRTVVVGGGEHDPLAETVAALGLQSDVVLPGWVSDDQLGALYAAATVYACPSLTEGFGLPVVDALRAGCLVVANDVPVLREVGGEHAFYADARNPQQFGRQISRVLELEAGEREERRAAGRAWAERFTWDASALGVADVLRAAAEARRPRV